MNLILQDRIKKLEETEFETTSTEMVAGKAKEKLEKQDQKIAALTEERRKFRREITKLKEDRDELRKKYSELQEKLQQ